MVSTAPAENPVPSTTFGLTVAVTLVSEVCRLMAAAMEMALAAFVEDVVVSTEAVSSDVKAAPMLYPLIIRSPALSAVGAAMEPLRALLMNWAVLLLKVPNSRSALAKVPPTLLLTTMLLWLKLRSV